MNMFVQVEGQVNTTDSTTTANASDCWYIWDINNNELTWQMPDEEKEEE